MVVLSFILAGILFTAASPFPTTTGVRKYKLPEPGVCGISVVNRIGAGKEPPLIAHPWTALIGLRNIKAPHEMWPVCVGSLISDQFILTAAHCFNFAFPGQRNIVVRLGGRNIESEMDCDGNVCSDNSIDFVIEKYQLHEIYDHPKPFNNDIALMKLPRPVRFTEFISPVCLPLFEDLEEEPKIGRVLTTIVWETKGMEYPWYDVRFTETNITAAENENCHDFIKHITAPMFCTINSTYSRSCSDNTGGPVVAVENDGFWYQYGIVSLCQSYEENSVVGVSVNVTSYLPWIMKTMSQLGDIRTSGLEDVERSG